MGRFTLRLPETLHQELETRAAQEGVSLNQYVVYALTRQVAAAYTVQALPAEHIREQRAGYEALLKSLGTPSLAATREFLAGRAAAEPEEELTEEMIAGAEARIAEAARRAGGK